MATTQELFQYSASLDSSWNTYCLEGTVYRLDVSVSDLSPRNYEELSEIQTTVPFMSLTMHLKFKIENSCWLKFNSNSANLIHLAERRLVPLLSPIRKKFGFSFNFSVDENKHLVASGYFVLENEGSYWPKNIPNFYFRVLSLREGSLCVEESSDGDHKGKIDISYDWRKRMILKFEKENNCLFIRGSIETLMGPTSNGFITEHSEGLEVFFNKRPILLGSENKEHFRNFLMNRPTPCNTTSIENIQAVEIVIQLRREPFNRVFMFYFPHYSFEFESLTPVQIDFPLFYAMREGVSSSKIFRFDMVTLFLDPRNVKIVPVTTVRLNYGKSVLYLPVKMEVIPSTNFFLVKTDYHLDNFEMRTLNYIDTKYLRQSTKVLSYQMFREEVNIRKFTFEDLLLRFPLVMEMEPDSNPLLQNVNYREMVLTSFQEILSVLRSYIEQKVLVGSWNCLDAVGENWFLFMKLQDTNLNVPFLVQNYFAVIELMGFSDKDDLKLQNLNILLDRSKIIFEEIKELYWADFGVDLELSIKEKNSKVFTLISEIICWTESAIDILLH